MVASKMILQIIILIEYFMFLFFKQFLSVMQRHACFAKEYDLLKMSLDA